MSRKNFYMTMRRFLLIMLSLLPVALALAGGGGWMFAHRALKPVDRMTDVAKRIGSQHLRDRLDLTGTGDELDRLAATLNEMLSRLDSAFSEMRQFTADASHELQTPLTILRGEIEVALRAPRSIEEYTTVLKSALEEIERISSLVEGLLLLARADAGVLKMDQQTVDLARVVDEIMDRASHLAQMKSIKLLMGHIEPLETTGDFVHLKRLLLNLVDNGIKYTPSGGSVKVSLERKEEKALISIMDNGPGIPPDEQPQIFQRFYRSPEARSKGQGGSGLGLSIVKSIAEAHGGRIELESTPGRGSIFKVYLPLKS
jgi:heavy metal sensor kinase